MADPHPRAARTRTAGRSVRALMLAGAILAIVLGGLFMSRLTDVPGSSAYIERGFISYSNRAKAEDLGVPEALIEEHGAVSEPVARAMAEGALAHSAQTVERRDTESCGEVSI